MNPKPTYPQNKWKIHQWENGKYLWACRVLLKYQTKSEMMRSWIAYHGKVQKPFLPTLSVPHKACKILFATVIFFLHHNLSNWHVITKSKQYTRIGHSVYVWPLTKDGHLIRGHIAANNSFRIQFRFRQYPFFELPI